uniref:Uncharacterized protein n=1 Tax=Haplochromis burtoni TaxID=8153 RepID=A0A3Q2WZK4_HAPBU
MNEQVQDNRRQLIGYLLERDCEWGGKLTDQTGTQRTYTKRIKKGSSVTKKGSGTIVLATSEHTPAQSKPESLIYMAARIGDLLLLEELLKDSDINTDGLTPLHIASMQGHTDTVIQLLHNKAEPGVTDRLGRTALHWAAFSQVDSCVVDLLLSAKADPDATDNEKKTPLHLAAMEGKVDVAISLLSHRAKRRARDMDGSTPLHYAAAGGHVSVVTALLQPLNNKGTEDRNAWRKTPLHAAAEKGHDSVALRLLEAGAKINATDHNKDTPLHCGEQDHNSQSFLMRAPVGFFAVMLLLFVDLHS